MRTLSCAHPGCRSNASGHSNYCLTHKPQLMRADGVSAHTSCGNGGRMRQLLGHVLFWLPPLALAGIAFWVIGWIYIALLVVSVVLVLIMRLGAYLADGR
jgi:hypothetical protein